MLGGLPVTFQDVLLGDALVGEKAIGGFGVGPVLASLLPTSRDYAFIEFGHRGEPLPSAPHDGRTRRRVVFSVEIPTETSDRDQRLPYRWRGRRQFLFEAFERTKCSDSALRKGDFCGSVRGGSLYMHHPEEPPGYDTKKGKEPFETLCCL